MRVISRQTPRNEFLNNFRYINRQFFATFDYSLQNTVWNSWMKHEITHNLRIVLTFNCFVKFQHENDLNQLRLTINYFRLHSITGSEESRTTSGQKKHAVDRRQDETKSILILVSSVSWPFKGMASKIRLHLFSNKFTQSLIWQELPSAPLLLQIFNVLQVQLTISLVQRNNHHRINVIHLHSCDYFVLPPFFTLLPSTSFE